MARNRHLRRRPSTPDLKLAQHDTPIVAADPTSPPETPTTSPHATRKSSHKPRHQPPPFHDFPFPGQDESNIRPLGHGHLFSYQPRLGPEMSPRSVSSSSDADDESGSTGSSLAAEANIGSSPEQSESEAPQCRRPDSESEESSDNESSIHILATEVGPGLIVEEIDHMDSDYEGIDALFPAEIDSDRSPSRPDIDGNVIDNLRKLKCSNEASDDDARSTSSSSSSSISRDSAEIAFYKRAAELKRIRRVSMSSSLGKRTHSEMSGDSDGDSTTNDASDLPSSARRMRKRLHRTSLLFQDPPAPRIDELEEPDSSEDERRFATGFSLAHELPYWDIEVVEIESILR